MRNTCGLKRGGSPGRPKGIPNKASAEIRALAQEYTPEAIRILVKIMRSSPHPQARVAAIRELLDRGHGKAAQAITGDGDGPVRLVISWSEHSES
jgi:hypothetical protein